MRDQKILVGLGVCFSLTIPMTGSGQAPQPIPIEAARKYFAEAQSLCQADHGQLWGVTLCGPVMFVDPQSRFIVANQADGKRALKAEGGVFYRLTAYRPKCSEYGCRMVRRSLDADALASI